MDATGRRDRHTTSAPTFRRARRRLSTLLEQCAVVVLITPCSQGGNRGQVPLHTGPASFSKAFQTKLFSSNVSRSLPNSVHDKSCGGFGRSSHVAAARWARAPRARPRAPHRPRRPRSRACAPRAAPPAPAPALAAPAPAPAPATAATSHSVVQEGTAALEAVRPSASLRAAGAHNGSPPASDDVFVCLIRGSRPVRRPTAEQAIAPPRARRVARLARFQGGGRLTLPHPHPLPKSGRPAHLARFEAWKSDIGP